MWATRSCAHLKSHSQEAEAGGLLYEAKLGYTWFQGQPQLHSNTLSQKTTKIMIIKNKTLYEMLHIIILFIVLKLHI